MDHRFIGSEELSAGLFSGRIARLAQPQDGKGNTRLNRGESETADERCQRKRTRIIARILAAPSSVPERMVLTQIERSEKRPPSRLFPPLFRSLCLPSLSANSTGQD